MIDYRQKDGRWTKVFCKQFYR